MTKKTFPLDKQTMSDIGVALWQLRQEKRLYIEQIAKQTQIPARAIDGIEMGKYTKYGYLRRLMTFYGKKIKIIIE